MNLYTVAVGQGEERSRLLAKYRHRGIGDTGQLRGIGPHDADGEDAVQFPAAGCSLDCPRGYAHLWVIPASSLQSLFSNCLGEGRALDNLCQIVNEVFRRKPGVVPVVGIIAVGARFRLQADNEAHGGRVLWGWGTVQQASPYHY